MKNKEPTRRSCRIPKNNEESPSFAGRKRKNSSLASATSKMQRKADAERKTDEYCWICHQLGHDLTCNSCPRVYHSNCIKKKHLQFNASGSCGECQAQFLSGGTVTPSMHKYSLTDLLELAMQEALKEDVKKNNQRSQPRSTESKFWKYFETWPENSSLCQIIDLSILIDKMKKQYYLTTADFFSDVKWIYHNCYILHGVDSEITETALKLEKNFKQELLDLEACGECYFNKHIEEDRCANFFTRVCEEPHDIVWAKLRGSPFWPAKCMGIFNGHAIVSFFGTHDKSSIQPSHCFRISQKSPNDREIKQSKYLDAITELSIYVTNYRIIYNSFPYFPYRTPLVDSKVITPKKPHKRGRHRRNPSDKQLNDSSLSEISNLSTTVVEPRNSIKGLFSNLSTTNELSNSIKGVQMKLSTSLQHSPTDSSPPSSCEINCAELPSRRRNPSEPVAVCMTFSTDDEIGPYNQISLPSKLISEPTVESSVPREYSTPVTSCSPIIVETPNYLHSTDDLVQNKLNSCTETILQNNSPQFVNSGSSSLLPVITSVSAEAALNPTFTSEQPVCFSNENLLPENSEIIHDFSSLLLSHANMPNSENAYAGNLLGEQGKEFTDSSVAIEDDDDEIVILKQDPPKESKAVNAILNNSGMAHALSQILSSNRPHLQELYKKCLDFGLKSFLQIWLSSNIKKHDESDVLMFLEVYDKVSKANEALKEENVRLQREKDSFGQEKESLKQEKESLKQAKESLRQENELLKHRNENLQVELETINLRKTNAERIAAFLNINAEKLKHEAEHLETMQSQNDSSLKEIRVLKEKLCESEKNLLEKDRELNTYKERVLQLEDQLKSALKKATCTSSECQTSLSDLPDNQMYTLKELEEVKQACQEQSSNERAEPSEDDNFSTNEDIEVVTRHTVTEARTSSLIEVEEGAVHAAMNSLNTHVFGNSSFFMECAVGHPITVVSSPISPSVILNPDYNSHQSTNSTPRIKYKKKKYQHGRN